MHGTPRDDRAGLIAKGWDPDTATKLDATPEPPAPPAPATGGPDAAWQKAEGIGPAPARGFAARALETLTGAFKDLARIPDRRLEGIQIRALEDHLTQSACSQRRHA